MFHENDTIIAVPPGETIREQLALRHMPQKELAARMGMSEKHISNLINGKVGLTQETALKLEGVLGIPARFWNQLEAFYQEEVLRIKLGQAQVRLTPARAATFQ